MTTPITYKHRCKRCGVEVVPATVAGNQRWAQLKLDRFGAYKNWQYVCYDGLTHPFRTTMDRARGVPEPTVLWHEGVEMDAQEVVDLELLNAVLNW